jgi:hypothetical protein
VVVLLNADRHADADGKFFELANPGHLSLMLFASGYGSDKYGTTHGGFELEQSVTSYVGVVGRASAYQIDEGTGFDNPISPGHRSSVRNFGRFEGGIALTPWQGTTFVLLGGRDVGDSDAPIIDSDFSDWLLLHTIHPINFSFSAAHYYENDVTSSRLDVRVIVLSTADLMLLAGAGGAIWGGGSVGVVKGQGGPDVGFFLRNWHLSVDMQAGYGSAHTYGLVSLSRQFGWDE